MKKNNRLLSLQKKYQKILLNDGGLRTLCNVLGDEMGTSIFILDRFREDLIYVDRELRQDEQFYSYLDDKEIEKQEVVFEEYGIKLNKLVYSWEDKKHTELQVKLGHEGEVLGVLVIFEPQDVDDSDYLIIMQAVYALSLKLHQNDLIQSLARKCSNELIEDLLKGRIEESKELVKRGELAGWDLTVSYQLFIIDFTSLSVHCAHCNHKEECERKKYCKKREEKSFYSYEMEERIIHTLHRIIKTNISRKYIIFSYENNILLLINYPKFQEEVVNDIKTIHQKLKHRFSDVNINIAAGRFVEDCCLVPKSYQEGLYTLEFLEATNQVNQLFFYEDLGVLRLLWQLDHDKLIDFTEEFLAKLIEYDQQNSTAWVDTLGSFLKNNGSIKQAANELHIHPNTMRYRIKRIQEILNLDLYDFETQLNLATAYKIYKFIISTLLNN